MKKLALLGNALVIFGFVYTLAIHGLLTFWADESGIGFSINSYQFPQESCDGAICD